MMIEDSVDNFILNYKTYASEIEILPKLEGSSLVEAIVANKVLHFFERTGPYDSKVGKARAILNINLKEFYDNPNKHKSVEVIGISSVKLEGLVLERMANTIILDAGSPFVVSSFEDIPDDIIAGGWVALSSIAPIHGFVLPEQTIRPLY